MKIYNRRSLLSLESCKLCESPWVQLLLNRTWDWPPMSCDLTPCDSSTQDIGKDNVLKKQTFTVVN